MDHEARLGLARRVTEYLLRKHPDIVAVNVHGSTAIEQDRDHSDLDMLVVTGGPSKTRSYQIVHAGILVKVDFTTMDGAFREAASVGSWWPFEADRWTSFIALYDPEGLLPRLAEQMGNPDPSKLPEPLQERLWAVYEYLCKIRNHVSAGEEDIARFVSQGAALHAACFLGLLNRQHFHSWRNLLTKPQEFEKLPGHFWEDYPRLLVPCESVPSLLKHAERLYRECEDLLRAESHGSREELRFEEALEAGRIPS